MSRHFQHQARRSFWQVHIEAWRQSGLSRAAYCREHRLSQWTFTRWLNHLVGEEEARKHTEYLQQLRREKRRKRPGRKPRRYRCGVRTDTGSAIVQAFWAMHVEAMNWSGMGIYEYASALRLSSTSLRKWRDRFEDGEVVVDWRAHLHPSARAMIRPSPKREAAETDLTTMMDAIPEPPEKPRRRRFGADEKKAIVAETEAPGATVSSVARHHGITTSMLFRWRAELGLGRDKGADLVEVALAGGDTGAASALSALQALVRPPDGMMAVELDNGRRVFVPEGSDVETVKRRLVAQETSR